MKLAVTHTVLHIHTYLFRALLFSKVSFWGKVGTWVCFFFSCFSPLRQRLVYRDILIPLPLSVLLSLLLPFLCDSLILCPSYGLSISPHFIDSVGALPYPSPERHSAWPIPIRQRPCHEQKSHCDQACIQLPMSLLALAAPAAWLFEQGWDFSLQSAEEESDECRWYSSGWRVWMRRAVRVQGYLNTDPDWEEARTSCSFLKHRLYNWADVSVCAGMILVKPLSGKRSSWISTCKSEQNSCQTSG